VFSLSIVCFRIDLENVINVFTNPELLKGIDSNQCTLIRANIPQVGTSQSLQINCGLFCHYFNVELKDCAPRNCSQIFFQAVWKTHHTSKLFFSRLVPNLTLEMEPSTRVTVVQQSNRCFDSRNLKKMSSSMEITRMII
jgi:hypothetical protein